MIQQNGGLTWHITAEIFYQISVTGSVLDVRTQIDRLGRLGEADKSVGVLDLFV
ncbi:MAG: hypothetical protein ABI778_01170 [Ignavibacteriota bacterium]